MGLKCSPDIAQSVMENALAGIYDTDIYINDVGAFSSLWQEHLNLLDTILHGLSNTGFTVNLLKC
jgi:ADP-glucose pyrophosphorylase